MSISVCLATHNGARFIKAQLDSILPQLQPGDELLVSDDNSQDETVRILQSYNDKCIKILPPQKFNSPIKNFEYCLNNCSNDIVFLADQDDVWHANKIKVMTERLQFFDLVVCDCRLIDEQGQIVNPSFYNLNRSGKGLLRNFFKNSFVGCCMAFKKEILGSVLPFPQGISMHDQWIGLMAQKYYNVDFLPQILVDHRRHDANFSTTGSGSKNSLEKKVISRIKLAKMLLSR